jgi:hypothetical protein
LSQEDADILSSHPENYRAAMRRTLVLGMVWGALCGLGNGAPVASTLVQMAVPWIWVAAFVGYHLARRVRRAAILGGLALLAANIAYFGVGVVWTLLADDAAGGDVRFLVLWTGVGLFIGPLAGMVGWWLTNHSTILPAVVLLATVSTAEPLALWAHIDHLDAHIAYVGVATVGLAFPLLFFRRKWSQAVRAVFLTAALTYPVAVVLEATLIALGQISSPMRLL